MNRDIGEIILVSQIAVTAADLEAWEQKMLKKQRSRRAWCCGLYLGLMLLGVFWLLSCFG